MLRRGDFMWVFRKECLRQLRSAHGDTSNTQISSGGGLKRQSDTQINGECKRLKGHMPQPIVQALQPIFNKFGCELKLSTLLAHDNANVDELLGPDNRGTCTKDLLLGCCSTCYAKRQDWNHTPALVHRIV